VFLEQNVDTPIDSSRKNRWWRSYLAWVGGPTSGATLPWTMTDSGYNIIEGPVNENLGKQIINDSLARPPKAAISAQVQRVGNRYHFDIQVTNLSGVTLSSSNEATVYAIVYEKVDPDYVNYLTSRYVRAVASTGISSLADGATASYSLDTADLSGVDWGRLHPVVLVDYRPGGSGYYDMLQAAFEYSPSPFEVRKYAEPDTVDAGDPLTYTIQVINTSEMNADFTATDNLPQQVTYTGPTVWSPFALSPGSIWETTFVVTVSDSYSGTLTNQVVVTNTQGARVMGSATVNAPAGGGIYLPLVLRTYGDYGDWEIVLEEDFEGSFPGSWVIDDNSAGYEWAKRDCKPYKGTYSGWAAGGGTTGAGLSCGTHTVVDTINTHMTYGPFSLSDGSQAQLKFKYWFNTDIGDPRDLWFCADFSTDGTSWFEESCIYGNSGGWVDATFDLAKYGVVGADQVWIRILVYCPSFYTPLTLTDGGVFIDNVIVRKR
jgi:uncharacterized repeat protein (TIGR01451 family)